MRNIVLNHRTADFLISSPLYGDGGVSGEVAL